MVMFLFPSSWLGINTTSSEAPIKPFHKKRSQVFNRISASVTPVAKRVAVPAKRLSISVATKMSPRKIVGHAQAKCNSIMSGVHDHLPHLKKVTTSYPDDALISRRTTTKVPARDSIRWRLPRKHSTL